MPLIKSAKKRVKIAHKAATRNSKTKRSLKSAWKAFTKSPTNKTQASAESTIDIALKKGLIHKNKAARQKSRLAAEAKAAGVKTGAVTKKATAKPATKPATAPAAKKAAAKKPAAKKAK
jgi:small subunit ribosomal protein S20